MKEFPKLELRRNLDEIDPIRVHDFVFDAHETDRSALITRYRGTVVRRAERGWNLVAWQKSVYHFGGLNREVPVFATVLLDEDGVVRGLSLDERCVGSQGSRCDFHTLQAGMIDRLIGKPFAEFEHLCPGAGPARCLHLYEILSGASGFFAELRGRGLDEGTEQELVRICPDAGGVRAENRHIVLGRENVIELDLRCRKPPQRGDHGLICVLEADADVRCNGAAAFSEQIDARRTADVTAALSLLFGRCYGLERRFFGFVGQRRARFTNCTALAGLFLLTFSHESMAGTLSRALRIERMLHFIQTGEGRTGCIGFEK